MLASSPQQEREGGDGSNSMKVPVYVPCILLTCHIYFTILSVLSSSLYMFHSNCCTFGLCLIKLGRIRFTDIPWRKSGKTAKIMVSKIREWCIRNLRTDSGQLSLLTGPLVLSSSLDMFHSNCCTFVLCFLSWEGRIRRIEKSLKGNLGFKNPGMVWKKSADSGQLSLLTGPLNLSSSLYMFHSNWCHMPISFKMAACLHASHPMFCRPASLAPLKKNIERCRSFLAVTFRVWCCLYSSFVHGVTVHKLGRKYQPWVNVSPVYEIC